MLYNLKQDLPDHRDRVFLKTAPTPLPSLVDLRPAMPPIYNQGDIGSCTANAIAGQIQFLTKTYVPSRLFIYYNERAAQGDPSQDSGSTLRIGMKTTQTFGACPETDWVYDHENLFLKPTATCYIHGLPDRVHSYNRIITGPSSLDQVKISLTHSLPVSMGFVVYPSFESEYTAKTGIMLMPALNEAPIGGHAVLIVGYDDDKSSVIVRNSWGADWGLAGYFYMPYNILTNQQFVMDLWVIDVV